MPQEPHPSANLTNYDACPSSSYYKMKYSKTMGHAFGLHRARIVPRCIAEPVQPNVTPYKRIFTLLEITPYSLA